MGSWLRAGLCFGIALMLSSLLISGEISLYVNPRFKWLIGISVLLLIILGTVQLWNLRGGELHRVRFWGYFLVSLPVLIYIFLPPKVLDASVAQQKGVTYVSPNAVATSSTTTQPNGGSSGEPEIMDVENPYKKMIQEIKQQPVITLTEKNYSDYMNAISLYPEEVKGKKIKLIGFVYRDETLKEDEFVTGRFTVTCCAADATVVGFLTKWNQAQTLKLNQWVEVNGQLDMVLSEGFNLPIIQLESYEMIEPLKDPYIYFQ
ncbi:TIGR03943 family putative permease subunit [Hazenella coriacea]|uniref:Putative membrane protein n=1 Tax=Hazenella coriacea TaxID=1179467 RepID=A0A4R3L9A1_9BACL|nr:TIGR03943 family protein [Hazenella coriacea]TCS95680.1 putative membrane protein [Hazenella coriacea]